MIILHNFLILKINHSLEIKQFVVKSFCQAQINLHTKISLWTKITESTMNFLLNNEIRWKVWKVAIIWAKRWTRSIDVEKIEW